MLQSNLYSFLSIFFNEIFSSIQVWFDNKAWASSVSYLNAINNVILRSSLPPSKDPFLYGITAINHPMEFSSREVVKK
jgi:ATP-binding cassette subfamily A (ABC1) protein 1